MKKTYLIPSIALAALFLSACRYTGSGHMDSRYLDSDKQVKYSFNVQECNGEDAEGHFTYHDKGFDDLKIKGEVTSSTVCEEVLSVASVVTCPPNLNAIECKKYIARNKSTATATSTCSNFCETGDLKIDFDYQSSNPKNPGDGTGYVCITEKDGGNDLDNGVYVAESAYIKLDAGPYSNYQNKEDSLTTRRIKQHKCPKPKK